MSTEASARAITSPSPKTDAPGRPDLSVIESKSVRFLDLLDWNARGSSQTADAHPSVALRTIVRTTPDAAPPASGAIFPAESETLSAATPATGALLLARLGSPIFDTPAPVGTSRRTTLNASVLA